MSKSKKNKKKTSVFFKKGNLRYFVILFVIAVAVVATVFVRSYISTTSMLVGENGVFLASSELEKSLKKSEIEHNPIEVISFGNEDYITMSNFGSYIGTNKEKLEENYPLFLKQGESMMTLDDKSVLFDPNFQTETSFKGMIVSNGYTFTSDGTQADADDFIIMKLPNDLYINTNDMTIHSKLGDVSLNQNDILYFEETGIYWYEYDYQNATFEYEKNLAIDETIDVSIGEYTYNYHDFLVNLGVVTEPTKELEKENTHEKTEGEGVYVSPSPTVRPQPTRNTSQSSPAQPAAPENPEQVDYMKPEVTIGEFTTSVYNTKTSIQISDPYARLYRGIKIEIYSGNTLYLRRTVRASSENLVLSPLEPDKEYRIFASYIYFDKSGVKQTVEFLDTTIHTRPMSDLVPMDIQTQAGQIYSESASFSRFNITNPEATNDSLGVKDTAEAIQSIQIEFAKKDSVVRNNDSKTIVNLSSYERSSFIKTLTQTEDNSYITGRILGSSTYYNYEFKFYDRFKNELPLTSTSLVYGELHTCKRIPTASYTLMGTEIDSIRVSVSTLDEDNAGLENVKMFIYADDKTTIINQNYEHNGETLDYIPLAHADNQEVTVKGLLPSSIYYVVFKGDYDINDDCGLQTEAQIGTGMLSTLSLDSLGGIQVKVTSKDIDASSATVGVELDLLKINEQLITLLDHLEINISKQSENGAWLDIYPEPFVINKDELIESHEDSADTSVKNEMTFDELLSNTTYRVNVKGIVKFGETEYNISTYTDVKDFITYKKDAEATIENIFTTSKYIELFNVYIEDTDNAISNDVNLIVRNSRGLRAFTLTLSTNTLYSRIKVDGLEKDEVYSIKFYAVDYNIGHTTLTAESNYEISNSYVAEAKDTIEGKLLFNGLNSVDENNSAYGVNLISEESFVNGDKKGINATSGSVVSDSSWAITDYIPVEAGATYGLANCYYNYTYSGNGGYAIYYKTDDGEYKQVRVSSTQYARGVVKIPSDSSKEYYIRITAYRYNSDFRKHAFFAKFDSAGKSDQLNAGLDVAITDQQGQLARKHYSITIYQNGVLYRKVDDIIGDEITSEFTTQLSESILSSTKDSYLIELSMDLYGFNVVLDTLKFDASNSVTMIHDSWELAQVYANPSGNYMLANDINCDEDESIATYDKSRIIARIADNLSGKIDFNGYQLTISNQVDTVFRGWSYLFGTITKDGVVENLVLEVPEIWTNNCIPTETNTNPVTGSSNNNLIVGTNYGTIRNAIVRFKGTQEAASENMYYTNSVRIMGTNHVGGVVENLDIDLGGNFYVSDNWSMFEANYGKIHNARIHGGDVYVYGTVSNGVAFGVRYMALGSASIQNMIIQGNIYITPMSTYPTVNTSNTDVSRVHLVVANTASLRKDSMSGVLAVGELYRPNTASATGYDQYVDTSLMYIDTIGYGDAYYCSTAQYNIFSQHKGQYRVDAAALYSSQWFTNVMHSDSGVNYAPISAGYFPEPNMPDCMPNLPAIQLPEAEGNTISLAATVVKSSQDDNAIVQFMFYNPRQFAIKKINMPGLTVNIINTVFEEDSNISIVSANVKINNDVAYVSSYYVSSFTAWMSEDGSAQNTYDLDGFVVEVDFYRRIDNLTDWQYMMNHPNENFTLQTDLNFDSNLITEVAYNSTNSIFTGKLKGNNHTVSNIHLTTSRPALFSEVRGQIKDLTIDTIDFIGNQYRVGVVAYLNMGMLDGVHVKNADFTKDASSYSGSVSYGHSALTPYARYAQISNCSSTNTKITLTENTKTASGISFSGLVGYAYYSVIENSFVQNLVIDAEECEETLYVSGIASYCDNSSITNVYATGSLNVFGTWVGGISASQSNTVNTNAYSYVLVRSLTGGAGGVFAYQGGGYSDNIGILAIGNVNTRVAYEGTSGRFIGYISSDVRTTGTNNAFNHNYLYYNQQMNTDIRHELNETEVKEVEGFLNAEDLKDADTYDYLLAWDSNSWYKEEISAGILPKLYSTEGLLLPYQEDVMINDSAHVTFENLMMNKVAKTQGTDEYSRNPNDYLVIHGEFMVDELINASTEEKVAAAASMKIQLDDLSLDSMQEGNDLAWDEGKQRFVFTLYYNYDRALDFYYITSISFGTELNTKVAEVEQKVTLPEGEYVYHIITNSDSWQAIMASHGYGYENFMIVGDVNFNVGIDQNNHYRGLKVNRLIGLNDQGGAPTISNLAMTNDTTKKNDTNYSFNKITVGSETITTVGLIDVVNSELSNVKFDSLSNEYMGSSYAGIIKTMNGAMRDITFTNCSVSANRNYAGMVGLIRYSPMVENIVIDQCSISNTDTATRSYTAGLTALSYSSQYHNILVKNSTIYGDQYVGGVFANLSGNNKASSIHSEFNTITARISYADGIAYNRLVIDLDQYNNDPDENKLGFKVNDCVIKSAGNAGGLFGYAYYGTETVDFPKESYDNVIESTGVDGFAGGVIGERNSWTYVWDAEVRGNTIISRGSAAGIGGGYVGRSTIENNVIYGAYQVGGAVPLWAYASDCYIVGNTISTIFDPSYGELIVKGETEPRTVATVRVGTKDNTRIGGVGGELEYNRLYIVNNVIADNFIGGEGASYVGGVVGYSQRKPINSSEAVVTRNAIINNTIRGENYVGGLGGTLFFNNIYTNSISNEIIATGDYVGGIAGKGGDIADVNLGTYGYFKLFSNIISGSVKGNNYVGGYFGELLETKFSPYSYSYNLSLANVEATQNDATASLTSNIIDEFENPVAESEVDATIRQFASSTLTKGSSTQLASQILTSAEDSARLVTHDLLKEPNYWKLKSTKIDNVTYNGLYYNATSSSYYYVAFDFLNENYLPAIRTSTFNMPSNSSIGGKLIMYYQEGKDENGVYYDTSDDVISGGIPIPEDASTFSYLMLEMGSLEPEVQVYASGVDTLNIEWSNLDLDLNGDYVILAEVTDLQGKLLAEIPLTQRVTSFYYDYQTDCVIQLVGQDNTSAQRVPVSQFEEIKVIAEEMNRDLSMKEDEYYILSRTGITTSKDFIEGTFANIYLGQALYADGSILNLQTREKLTGHTAFTPCTTSVPLFEGNVEGWPLKTYASYLTYGDNEMNGYFIVTKKETEFAVKSENGIQFNDYIVDNYLGKNYFVILLESGELYNVESEIVLPENFIEKGRNENIVEIASNIESDLPYLILRYENGNVYGFNYLTGEELTITLPESEKETISLLSYAESFFSLKGQPLQGNSIYYEETLETSKTINRNGISSLFMAIASPNGVLSENLIAGEVVDGKNETNSSAAELVDGESNNLEGSALEGISEEQGDGFGELVGENYPQNGVENVEHPTEQTVESLEGMASNGFEEENAIVIEETESLEERNDSLTSDLEIEDLNNGEENKVQSTVDNSNLLGTIVVFDLDKEQYDVYEMNELASSSNPMSVSQKYTKMNKYQKKSSSTTTTSRESLISKENIVKTPGLLLYLGTAMGVFALIVLLIQKRKNLF